MNVPIVNENNNVPEIGVECYDEENDIYEIYGLTLSDLQGIYYCLKNISLPRIQELKDRIEETLKQIIKST